MEPDYDRLAALTHSHDLAIQARNWIEHGQVPDSPFLRSVIRNDLKETVNRAIDSLHITATVKWFYHEAPKDCWGSDKCFSNWPLYIKAKKKQEEDNAKA